jgi:hypothetical protein
VPPSLTAAHGVGRRLRPGSSRRADADGADRPTRSHYLSPCTRCVALSCMCANITHFSKCATDTRVHFFFHSVFSPCCFELVCVANVIPFCFSAVATGTDRAVWRQHAVGPVFQTWHPRRKTLVCLSQNSGCCFHLICSCEHQGLSLAVLCLTMHAPQIWTASCRPCSGSSCHQV